MNTELLNIANQTESSIINTLIKMKASGLNELTIKAVSSRLKRLRNLADLTKPEEVKTAIANMQNIDNQPRETYVKAYNYYATTNQIQWTRPRYKWERKIPLIPSTENINKIISASTKKYATIFTLLKETGLEAHELATVQRKEIDAEQGIIYAKGCKGHNSRSFKLKSTTADILRAYLHTYTNEYPIPSSKMMGQ